MYLDYGEGSVSCRKTVRRPAGNGYRKAGLSSRIILSFSVWACERFVRFRFLPKQSGAPPEYLNGWKTNQSDSISKTLDCGKSAFCRKAARRPAGKRKDNMPTLGVCNRQLIIKKFGLLKMLSAEAVRRPAEKK